MKCNHWFSLAERNQIDEHIQVGSMVRVTVEHAPGRHAGDRDQPPLRRKT
jgi:hypothetical protein